MDVPHVYQPATIEELAALLAYRPSIRFLAGGTVEIPMWQHRPPTAEFVYLPAIAKLHQYGKNWCGSAVTLAQVASEPTFPAALRQAAASIGGPAIRNLATIGGNLAWGKPGCLAVALLALHSTVDCLEVGSSPTTTRRELAEIIGRSNSCIVNVQWHVPDGARTIFLKLGMRPGGGPNLATVAVCWAGPSANSRCAIAVGSIGALPHRLIDAEQAWAQLAHKPVAGATAAGQTAAATVETRASDDGYRRHLVGVLVRRALLALTGPEMGGRNGDYA